VRFVQCATDDAVGVADDEAAALLDDGWPPETVALLTTYSRHPPSTASGTRSGPGRCCTSGSPAPATSWSCAATWH
jgi:hypothetical protein